MSVCSSAKPYTKRPADGKSSDTPPAETVSRLTLKNVACLISASSSLFLECAEAGFFLRSSRLLSGFNHQHCTSHPAALAEGTVPLPPGEQHPARLRSGRTSPTLQPSTAGTADADAWIAAPIALAGVHAIFVAKHAKD